MFFLLCLMHLLHYSVCILHRKPSHWYSTASNSQCMTEIINYIPKEANLLLNFFYNKDPVFQHALLPIPSVLCFSLSFLQGKKIFSVEQSSGCFRSQTLLSSVLLLETTTAAATSKPCSLLGSKNLRH